MRKICRYPLAVLLVLLCIPFVNAQSSAEFNIGFGSAQVKSAGSGIDSIYSPYAFSSCTPGPGDPYCLSTPGLNGFFLGFGGDAMLSKHFGVGAEVSFQPTRSDYGPLQFRQTFYDFDGIFAPLDDKRIAVKLMGGIGGARTGFSFDQSACVGTALCSNSNQPVGSSNHFQLHAGLGIEMFLTDHVFIRPQFDLRYVSNFTDEFGSNVVPGATLWIGFGARHGG